MPRAKVDKPSVKSFQRGFVTEATGLSFPENCAKDLDNIDIELKGLARRRLGFEQEANGVLMNSGVLADETFAGSLGGPLSTAGGTSGAVLVYQWNGTSLGTDVGSPSSATLVYSDSEEGSPTTGDVQFTANDAGAAPLMPLSFKLNSQDGRTGALLYNANAAAQSTILITARVAINAIGDPNDTPRVQFLIGGTAAGTGPGISISADDYQKAEQWQNVSLSDWGTAVRTVNYSPGAGFYFDVSISLQKVATNSYRLTYVLTNAETGNLLIAETSPTLLSFTGDYIGIKYRANRPDPAFAYVNALQISTDSGAPGGGGLDGTVQGFEKAITVHKWTSPNGEDGVNFVVTQVGNTLIFRDADQSAVSLTGGDVPAGYETLRFDGAGSGFIYNTTAAAAARVRLQSSVGHGRIWFTSPAVIPFYAELDRSVPATPTIILRANGYQSPYSEIDVTGARTIRDFNGVPDGLEVDEQPATITAAHAYNLLNQGWDAIGSDHIDTYRTARSVYPSNAQQWFIGKDTSNNFDPAELARIDTGTTQVPRGRYTIDALTGDKDGRTHTISGLTTPIDFVSAHDEKASTGWATVAFFAGRVWYAGEVNSKRPNGIYFSKTLQSPRDSGSFFQEADPTSENISDLIATDGGVIYITEADRIRKLVPFGRGLLVMALNGIWYVYAPDGGFAANNYTADKISKTGVLSPETVIEADQSIFFWAENSIHAIGYSPVSNDPEQATVPRNAGGLPSVVDLAESTILTFYANIPRAQRDLAMGTYDKVAKKCVWLYRHVAGVDCSDSQFTRALIFDLRTGGFTKYSMADSVGDSDFWGVGPAFEARTTITTTEEENLTLNDDVTLVTLDDDTTILTVSEVVSSDASSAGLHLKFLWIDGRIGNLGVRIVEGNSLNFKDFTSLNEETDYTSFIWAFDEHLGELQRRKQATFVHSYFQRTEYGFDLNMIPRGRSGCTLQGRWEWQNSAAGNRWTTPQAAYRYRRPYTPANSDDIFDTGDGLIFTKLKMRGSGKALSLHYNSVSGKDFRLAGYSVAYTANGE